ncbi:hypothetical protein [Vibrio gallicus]|uniref:hypothetical protein n=1 Tax=Vibrio gallicus TaxID=190897 RepID=UPI0021C36F14|nr:hypothetical protein [Vibrio gallicus]
MSHLNDEQVQSLANFKSNIHLPHGGFHTLIVDLCREYQLPFPKVRTVVKASQIDVENKILDADIADLERIVTKQYWVDLIRERLALLAVDNKTPLQDITETELYRQCLESIREMKCSGATQQLQASTIESLNSVYEMSVYKPLKAMLHTTQLQWKLKRELQSMTEEQRTLFCDYPAYMQATKHLLDLCDEMTSLTVTR